MPREQSFPDDQRGILIESSPPSPMYYSSIVTQPHVLNGRVHDGYSRLIMTFSIILAIVLLAQLLLLYLYVQVQPYR
jgi:hypothetical protein